MTLGKYILAIDQGTTSTRAILFDALGGIASVAQQEFPQIYPRPGYVEHDAVKILQTAIYVIRAAVQKAGITAGDVAAIGITNQRETTVAWDRHTGIPVCNAIVWQCRRTAPDCERLTALGMGEYIKDTTGLLIDPYFSGTKMKWILDNVPAARELADKGRLCLGTIDSWLVFSLTEGSSFVTDISNASRTMLMDINKHCWDSTMLKELGIPESALPRIVECGGEIGVCSKTLLGREIPIAGMAGDQHAALFGQCCFDKGMAKNTYGTGCFVLMNTGEEPVHSKGLLTTVAWKLNGRTVYALEGSAFNAGSAIQWLRDELKMIETPQEADRLAETVEDTGGVSFVPAFTGLGAPYWDMYARGALLGITRGTQRAHVCRAVLESIALESYDLIHAMEQEAGVSLSELRADGGASRSRFLMQYQADISNRHVKRPACLETTALGSAMMAGLAVGLWESQDALRALWREDQTFTPDCTTELREQNLARWHRAVERSRGWAE
ncbi:MAG: glycerol kinase GlpK [Acutalibacter sp.]|jgi:glycerol kinase|uniref:glycerol kinase GlpK n=1 Tax=Acutalibacter sp. TaxID=1918636 RepID=UPI00216BB68F|nr:glycerol kinase GlpK [Acutalibacter sp.]MCI9224561.1 glycerol kinase GlpK [Acutalibacter sp.]